MKLLTRAGDRILEPHHLSEASMALLDKTTNTTNEVATPALLTA